MSCRLNLKREKSDKTLESCGGGRRANKRMTFSGDEDLPAAISGATLWTPPMIWPIILICALKYNIQKPLMEASLPHLGAFQKTEISISPPPPQSSGHADVLCGCRSRLNPATSKGRTSEHTVSLSQSNSRIFFLHWKFKKKKRKRNRK